MHFNVDDRDTEDGHNFKNYKSSGLIASESV